MVKKTHVVRCLVLVAITVLYVSCSTREDIQFNNILPENINIETVIEESGEYTDIRVFRADGKLVYDSLKGYPLNTLPEGGFKGWEVYRWHKPTEKELNDINKFFRFKNFSNNIISKKEAILRNTSSILVSYFYKDNEFIPGSPKFDSNIWIDVYIINLNDKRLIWVGQGRF